jgi:type IV pilus assembly protein PilO
MNDFIDKFNQVPLTQRVVGLILAMAVLGVGFGYLVYGPLQDQLARSEGQLQELKQKKQNLALLKEKKVRIQAKITLLEQELMIAKEKLPASAEIPSLLQRIYNKANTAGLEIRAFEPMESRPKPYYIEIPVAMELVGTYDELANFFYYVGQMTRIVNVKNLDIKRQESGLNQNGNLIVSAQATTFQMKPAGTAAPPKK